MAPRLRILLVLSLVFMLSCSNVEDEPIAAFAPKPITTVEILLTDEAKNNELFSFRDLDGPGGEAPDIRTNILRPNTEYTSVLLMLDESVEPASNITNQVAIEGVDHQVFYVVDGTNMSIEYIDTDTDGNPLGILTSITTGDPGTSSLTIVLRFQPDKSAIGVNQGDLNNAGGDTDIEVTFEIEVR